MPRKTKKQKIVSDYRKKLRELQLSSVTLTLPQTKLPDKQVKEKHVVAKQIVHKEVKQEVDREKLMVSRTRIAHDLRKTVMWSIIAICVEVVLYFVTTA